MSNKSRDMVHGLVVLSLLGVAVVMTWSVVSAILQLVFNIAIVGTVVFIGTKVAILFTDKKEANKNLDFKATLLKLYYKLKKGYKLKDSQKPMVINFVNHCEEVLGSEMDALTKEAIAYIRQSCGVEIILNASDFENKN